MQISSIVDIVEGELVNSPSISFIYNIKTKVNKIQEGDLFISNNKDEIKEALNKGAFGIIFDCEIDILDNEIAWIKVDDVNSSLTKLIRFKLSTFELNAYHCNDFTFELLALFTKNGEHNIKLISNNLEDDIGILEDIENYKTIICSNEKILNNIYPKNFAFNNIKYDIKNLIEHSLFETTFSYEDSYFPRVKLSSLYINDFLNVYIFLNKNIDINKLKKINTFKPLFIDKYFKLIDYGYSDKFIISQTNGNLAVNEINYINNKYKYARTFIFIRKGFYKSNDSSFYTIDSLDEIKNILSNKKFNAIYILGFNHDEINIFTTKNSSKVLL